MQMQRKWTWHKTVNTKKGFDKLRQRKKSLRLREETQEIADAGFLRKNKLLEEFSWLVEGNGQINFLVGILLMFLILMRNLAWCVGGP